MIDTRIINFKNTWDNEKFSDRFFSLSATQSRKQTYYRAAGKTEKCKESDSRKHFLFSRTRKQYFAYNGDQFKIIKLFI